jgi:hypothetical protein
MSVALLCSSIPNRHLEQPGDPCGKANFTISRGQRMPAKLDGLVTDSSHASCDSVERAFECESRLERVSRACRSRRCFSDVSLSDASYVSCAAPHLRQKPLPIRTTNGTAITNRQPKSRDVVSRHAPNDGTKGACIKRPKPRLSRARITYP